MSHNRVSGDLKLPNWMIRLFRRLRPERQGCFLRAAEMVTRSRGCARHFDAQARSGKGRRSSGERHSGERTTPRHGGHPASARDGSPLPHGASVDRSEPPAIDDLEFEVDFPDAYEELVEAADEAQDVAVVGQMDGAVEESLRAERSDSGPAPGDSGRTLSTPSAGEVRRLFSQLQIRRAPSGSMIIEAPDEAAETLGALFEGMAALLRSSASSGR